MTPATLPDRLRRLSPRTSFAGKIASALLGTIALLLLVTLLVVRGVTEEQVEVARERALTGAEIQFSRIATLQRERLTQVAERIIAGRRTVAALEAAIESGDQEQLLPDLAYELELAQLDPDGILLILTDTEGVPVLARAAGHALSGQDPADVSSFLDRMYEEGAYRLDGYRHVDDRLYNVQATYLDLAGRPVGTALLGLPLGDAEAAALGGVVGAELCFVADGSCVAGTERAMGDLGALLASGGEVAGHTFRMAGGRWTILSEALDPERPDGPRWSMAVPLDPVLGPFERVQRTLLFAGLAALLVAMMASLLLSRSLVRPVRSLVAATGRVAQGEYDTAVPVETQDELGTLARAFNDMTRGLLLKEQYRSVLDKVVSRDVAEELLQGELKLGGENREVTILFGDIRGFTATTEKMAPQEVIALVNECMEILSGCVDREAGVVDKYVGDEIMALFGAPVAQADAPARAVRAATGMIAGIAALNRTRASRGERPLGIGIGIASGEVVAGNVGATDRLNYTVLGKTVNLASRLCSAASAGRILISGSTRDALDDTIATHALDGLDLKGFSGDVTAYEVTPDAGAGRADGVVGSAATGSRGALVLLLAASVFSSGSLGAQDTGFAGWMSPTGQYQLALSGQLDVEAYVPGNDPPWLIPSTDPFVGGRLRIFADMFAGERVYGLIELRADRGEAPEAGEWSARLEQAFVRARPLQTSPLEIQLGRFASPFGGYPARHHTVADPFIRPPLTYEYRTVLSDRLAPWGVSDLLGWQWNPEMYRPQGQPPVWGVPYQWGGMVTSALGRVAVHVAWMNSAPSSGPDAWGFDADRFADGSLVAGVAFAASPELGLSVYYDTGPWMERARVREGPPGMDPPADPTWGYNGLPGTELPRSAYDQTLWGAEAVFARGPATLRGEVFFDTWETPNVPDDPQDLSWYLEGQVDVLAGLYLASRYGRIHFLDVTGPTGVGMGWDWDVSRLQVGAGYRLRADLGLRVEYMTNRTEGPTDPDDDLLSAQVSWVF